MSFYYFLLLTAALPIALAIVTQQTTTIQTISELAKSNEKFSSMSDLIRKTELGFKLDQSRDLTYLAPVNEAITNVQLDKIISSLEYDDVMSIFKSHVIPGIVKVEELTTGTHSFETLAGSTVVFKVWKPKKSNVEEQPPVTAMVSLKDSPQTVITIRSNEVIETINGPVYYAEKLLIPKKVEGVVAAARKKYNEEQTSPAVVSSPEGGSVVEGSDTFNVPEHVQETNRVQNEKDERYGTTTQAEDVSGEESEEKTNKDFDSLEDGGADVGVLTLDKKHLQNREMKMTEGLLLRAIN